MLRQRARLHIGPRITAYADWELGVTDDRNRERPNGDDGDRAGQSREVPATQHGPDVRAELEALHEHLAALYARVGLLETTSDVVSAGLRATAGRRRDASLSGRRLVILDDAFPQLLSAFRISEFNAYLAAWPDAIVYSTGGSFGLLGDTRSWADVIAEYEATYPEFANRVRPFGRECDLDGALVYMLFVNNANQFLDVIHAYDVPFVFTLYPGGGLQLEDDRSDTKLRRVCSSPNLQKVIVTQKVVDDYLRSGGFCPSEKIEFIYGGVYPSTRLAAQLPARPRYGLDKGTFDVCFVAHKYMARGVDKGYDLFVEAAAILARQYDDVRFHVVGSFDASDIDVTGLGGNITFYGTRPTDFFPGFYASMDAIVAPNAPNRLAPGAFDIFPTGTCIEAASCGVVVFATDPFAQNVVLREGEEIVIVSPDAGEIAMRVGWYHDHPEALQRISAAGQSAFVRIFDIAAQMQPRLALLSRLMGAETAGGVAADQRELTATQPLGDRW